MIIGKTEIRPTEIIACAAALNFIVGLSAYFGFSAATGIQGFISMEDIIIGGANNWFLLIYTAYIILASFYARRRYYKRLFRTYRFFKRAQRLKIERQEISKNLQKALRNFDASKKTYRAHLTHITKTQIRLIFAIIGALLYTAYICTIGIFIKSSRNKCINSPIESLKDKYKKIKLEIKNLQKANKNMFDELNSNIKSMKNKLFKKRIRSIVSILRAYNSLLAMLIILPIFFMPDLYTIQNWADFFMLVFFIAVLFTLMTIRQILFLRGKLRFIINQYDTFIFPIVTALGLTFLSQYYITHDTIQQFRKTMLVRNMITLDNNEKIEGIVLRDTSNSLIFMDTDKNIVIVDKKKVMKFLKLNRTTSNSQYKSVNY